MSTQVQRRKGTTAQHASFTGASAELTVDTTKNTVVVHDGATAGGIPLAKETGSAISVTSLTSSGASVISVTDNTNAALRITQLGTGDALLVEDSANPDASPFVITNNGTVVAGYTSRVTSVNVIEAHSASGVNSAPAIGVYGWGTLATGGGLNLYKSRSGTVGTYSLVANGTQSSVRFQFDDGAAFQQAASIIGSAEGTPALNSMPGRLTFATTADGSVTPTERMRITSDGNLGFGVTPSAWNTFPALQTGGNYALSALGYSSNMYYQSGYKYMTTAAASRYEQASGVHNWFNAPSGTAGAAIAFTQAMTLDASGRLGLGTTTQGTNPDQMYIVTKASSKYALHLSHESVGSGAATVGAIRIDGSQGRGQGTNTGISIDISEIDVGACTGINAKVTGIYSAQYAVYQEISKNLGAYSNAYCNYATMATTSSGGAAYFYYAYDQNSAAVKFYVGQNGGISNYQANDTNLSDRREKTNFAPAGDYLAKICAIPVQTFNYIDQSENDPGLTLGVVAQDVQDVAPELVMESNWGTEETPKMRLSIYQTDLQYALMKCVQEQQALIESLTQRLKALESK